MKMTYIPSPIDTSDIHLQKDLIELTELLAKNTHEIWAKQRIEEGWKHGKERNDERKEHPCLIPYEELPDNEKEYDRNTAIETIRLLITLGYNINKNI